MKINPWFRGGVRKLMAAPSYTFTGGETPSDFTPNKISAVGSMIGKIADQTIRMVSADDRLSIFDKMPVKNGDTIEQVLIKLASAEAYDSTGAGALSRKNPDLAVRYFNDWTRAKYKHTVDISELRKVLETGKGVPEISAKVVGVLNESDKYEKYTQTKNLLAWGRQDGTGKVLKLIETVNYGTDAIDYKGVLEALKNAVSGMQFVNTSFNTASINRKTNASDIVILMPYKLKNKIDVQELAGVFNLDKAEVGKHIIELDTDVAEISGLDTYSIYVLDKNAILSYVRLYEMADQKNADGLFWNYFLHTERMYGISPLFDCGYINVVAEASQG